MKAGSFEERPPDPDTPARPRFPAGPDGMCQARDLFMAALL